MVDSGTLLAGAQFVDTYRVVVDGALLVDQAAEKMFARQPRWVEASLTCAHNRHIPKRNART